MFFNRPIGLLIAYFIITTWNINQVLSQQNNRGDVGVFEDSVAVQDFRFDPPVTNSSRCGSCTTSLCKCIGEKGSRVISFKIFFLE